MERKDIEFAAAGKQKAPARAREPRIAIRTDANGCAIYVKDAAPRYANRGNAFAALLKRIRTCMPNAMYRIFAIVALVCVVFSVTALIRRADELEIRDFGRVRAYAEYTVKDGDTLWSIAEDVSIAMPEYKSVRAYLEDLRSSNRIYTDEIRTGQVIALPYYRNATNQDEALGKYGI